VANGMRLAVGLKEKGAYFVVLKAEGASGSGIILRTDLDVEVQEEPESGRVRVNVLRAAGGYEPKASVWVIGSGNQEFTKGETDLRGLLIADNIQGTATVIASKGEQYAFHRGTTVLQPEAAEEKREGKAARAGKQPKPQPAPQADFDVQALNELYPRRLGTHRSGSSRNFPGRRAADGGQRVFSQTEPKSHRDFGVFPTFAGISFSNSAIQGLCRGQLEEPFGGGGSGGQAGVQVQQAS